MCEENRFGMINDMEFMENQSNNRTHEQEKIPESDPVIFARTAEQVGTSASDDVINIDFQNLQENLPTTTVTTQKLVPEPKRFGRVKQSNKKASGDAVIVSECQICQKQFRHQTSLNRHLAHAHHSGKIAYSCRVCGKRSRTRNTLAQHKKTDSSESSYVCDVCHKKFNRKAGLLSHKKIHTGIKSYHCVLCPKAFFQKGNWNRHLKTHLEKKKLKCDMCHKVFSREDSLARHKLKSHNAPNQYHCGICGASFPKRRKMRSHEREHDTPDRDVVRVATEVGPDEIEAALTLCALASSRMPGTSSPKTLEVQSLNRFGRNSTTPKTIAEGDDQGNSPVDLLLSMINASSIRYNESGIVAQASQADSKVVEN
ncbi:unnamed protein product [Ceutorhynchus assimilis]|uniref:C2H2-type domain-containing protein n=1 Tax=Ceutorhynchus assimilis TaxID=467358 RepID=A0A9P0DG30_9CUCU|nr:unnamed protein product [Ceutorhynchus assimilis]